ncbi:MAG TPA: hypothetical protein ENK60_02005 [Anaerolineae bacterium]|nr:hypothetical protein [Anaerolineae bacterium]
MKIIDLTKRIAEREERLRERMTERTAPHLDALVSETLAEIEAAALRAEPGTSPAVLLASLGWREEEAGPRLWRALMALASEMLAQADKLTA